VRFGRYQLHRKLAEGGMGEVFLASVKGVAGFEKPLVIKRLRADLSEDAEFVRLFIQEAKLTAQLTHPNIAQVLELGSVDNRYFIALEWVEGADVGQLLRTGGALPVRAALTIAADVARALDYAARKKGKDGASLILAHRDVSPQNVLVSREGTVKLTDFGIAKLTQQTLKTRTGHLRGKYAYLSPEQASRGRVDHRADLFALGLVLFEMSTGRRAYDAEGEVETLDRARNAELPSLLGLPPQVASLAASLLQREPEARLANGEQVRLEIDAILDGTGGPCPPHELAVMLADRFPTPLSLDSIDTSPPPSARAVTLAEARAKTQPAASPARRPRARFAIFAGAFVISLVALLRSQLSSHTMERSTSSAPVLTSMTAVASGPTSEPVLQQTVPSAQPNAVWGYLSVNCRPGWAYVYVDGSKHRMTTPLEKLRLPEGLHTLRLVHPTLQREARREVKILRRQTSIEVIEF
jgi:eukaryotic-like serine/threonine-protein kinase